MHPALHGKTLLFDVDGTIAETEGEGHLPAFNQAFREFEIPWSWSVADYAELLAVTGGFERMLSYARRVNYEPALTSQGHRIFRSIHQRKNILYGERLASGLIRPRQGFIQLIKAITEAGQQWAVVTTTSLRNWQSLREFAILPQGQCAPPVFAVCGEDVAQKKPSPEAYQHAVQRLQARPDECVAIEDSVNGLQAAQGASVPTVIVRSQFFGNEEFPGAIAVVDELSDLL